jgi:hypothetical protein
LLDECTVGLSTDEARRSQHLRSRGLV